MSKKSGGCGHAYADGRMRRPGSCGADGDAEPATGALEPRPQMLGVTVEHEDLEDRRLVRLPQDDGGAGEAGLDAAAGAENARMEVDARAFGEEFAGAWAGDGDRRARLRHVGHGSMKIAERRAQAGGNLVL